MAKKTEMDQLTKDSISAEKAGMSYGKYMAMKHIPPKTPKVVDDEQAHYCAECGKVIVHYRTGKKYCCHRCYEIAMSERARKLYRKKVTQCG